MDTKHLLIERLKQSTPIKKFVRFDELDLDSIDAVEDELFHEFSSDTYHRLDIDDSDLVALEPQHFFYQDKEEEVLQQGDKGAIEPLDEKELYDLDLEFSFTLPSEASVEEQSFKRDDSLELDSGIDISFSLPIEDLNENLYENKGHIDHAYWKKGLQWSRQLLMDYICLIGRAELIDYSIINPRKLEDTKFYTFTPTVSKLEF